MEYERARSTSEMKISEKKVANFLQKLWISFGAELTGLLGGLQCVFRGENRRNTKKSRDARRAQDDLETPFRR